MLTRLCRTLQCEWCELWHSLQIRNIYVSSCSLFPWSLYDHFTRS